MARNSACAARSGCGNCEPWEVFLLSHGRRGHGVREGMMDWACREAWIGNPWLCMGSWVVPHQNSPNPLPLCDSYLQLWQLYLKLSLNMHILCVQLHATIIESIFLWQSVQSFCTAFRFGKENSKQNCYITHLCTLRPHNLWILPCSEQDKVPYHGAALGTFLTLQPDRICWAKGFS